VFVGINTGSGFDFQLLTTLSQGGWSFWTGDFTGDGRLDIGAYESNSGQVFVGINTGSGFDFQSWHTVSHYGRWSFWPGDLNGDGRTDLIAYESNSGSVFIGISTGSNFDFNPSNRWATVSPPDGWSFLVGDFSGEGRIGMVGYHPSNGTLWLGRNMADLFYFGYAPWTSLPAPPSGWTILPGLFTTSGRTDILGYNPSDGSLWVLANPGLQPEGYAWPMSASPGETIEFKVSGLANPTVNFFRHKAGAGPLENISKGHAINFVPSVQAVQAHSWAKGAGWKRSFRLTVPQGWDSGIYSARLTSSTRGTHSHVPFVVKPDRAQESDVAMVLSINTWLAYNSWGGRSKYTVPTAAFTSFQRPAPGTDPVLEDDTTYSMTRGELWILGWLEDNHYHPHVYTDLDFHKGLIVGPHKNLPIGPHEALPKKYRKLVIGTHSEYWSLQMWDKLSDFLDSGGSLVYLGGNAIYEVGTYYEDYTGMVFFGGHDGEENRLPYLFRNPPQGKPETLLLGVATTDTSVPGKPYKVLKAEHPLFKYPEDTKLKNGDIFGDSGLNTGKEGLNPNGKASAWETDTSRDGPLPPGLVVLARASPPEAEMTFYEHPGGGSVFSAGSIAFGGSLVVDPVLQQIVRNVLALP
jgi:FG-GAP-like repeat